MTNRMAPGGHFAQWLDHLRVDAVRVRAADDIVAGDLVSALRAHAADLAVFDEDLFDFLPQLELRAVFLDLLLHAHAHLVRAVARHHSCRQK